MSVFFYIAAVIGVVSTALALTRAHAIHALLYFVVSAFSTAFIFYLLGAPFAAACAKASAPSGPFSFVSPVEWKVVSPARR